MSGDTLYIKIDKNILIMNPMVHLRDIAKLTGTNQSIVDNLKTLKIYKFQIPKEKKQKKKQYVIISILKVIELIGKEYPDLSIVNMGEVDFVIEYLTHEDASWIMIIKVIFTSLIVFFGAAFTIMTFNNDAGIPDIFKNLYSQVMGKKSNGFTVLEISYCIGLAAGILIFFNHIGQKKITPDPTPMQIEMRKYESDVDDTFIENSNRKGNNIDVD
jgi:stage V sporulation protein AA